MPSATTNTDAAIRLLAAGNLHQLICLPESASHARLRVTFATTSNFDDASLPVILFVGPMFGTRYMALRFDKLATAEGVRVICVDRPGLGGATPAPVSQRIPVWLETVPILLQRLGIKYVSLVSHSAGTTYTLNTLAHLRDILDPQAPYVAFLGPWIHSANSHMAVWSAAAKLPSAVISQWSNVGQFFNQRIMPAAAWSGGIVSSVASMFEAAPGPDSSDSSYEEIYGLDDVTGEYMETLSSKYSFAEGMSGASDEALLCLKKGGPGSWGVCDDYMHCVRSLADGERKREGPGDGRLQVRVHYAGSDIMSGKEGQAYFERCWTQEGIAEAIDVDQTVWSEANHETVLLDYTKGAMRAVFREVKSLHA